MSKPIIEVRGISKRYKLGTIGAQTMREEVEALFARFKKTKAFDDGNAEKLKTETLKTANSAAGSSDFWSLRDVSFDVQPGEVLGIIGRNGAGKSTLLKILSRITEPTSGEIRVRGRIASLLEVGTGFHPELSGRENIFLNGAILGMSKAEIRAKFDEIVDFAGVEQFIDTPVKRYSSGMYVRLAFAVAAHLEPEILIVDEVLAVGDAEFQKKCLGKMKDVAGHGRTILFVSHNMAAVNVLCNRAVLLHNGKVSRIGSTIEITDSYLSAGAVSSGGVFWTGPETAPGSASLYLNSVKVVSNSKISSDVFIDDEVQVQVEYTNLIKNLPLTPSIHLLDKHGYEILASINNPSSRLNNDEIAGTPHQLGKFISICRIPPNFLNEMEYRIRIAFQSNFTKLEFVSDEVLAFHAWDKGSMRKEYLGHWIGVVRPKFFWETKVLAAS